MYFVYVYLKYVRVYLKRLCFLVVYVFVSTESIIMLPVNVLCICG